MVYASGLRRTSKMWTDIKSTSSARTKHPEIFPVVEFIISLINTSSLLSNQFCHFLVGKSPYPKPAPAAGAGCSPSWQHQQRAEPARAELGCPHRNGVNVHMLDHVQLFSLLFIIVLVDGLSSYKIFFMKYLCISQNLY